LAERRKKGHHEFIFLSPNRGGGDSGENAELKGKIKLQSLEKKKRREERGKKQRA